jgi:hypothetical protein
MDNQPKITAIEIYLWFVVAIIVWLSNFIPIVGTICSVAFLIFFFLYLYLKKIPQAGPLIANLVGVIPFINLLPVSILSVSLAIAMDRVPALKKAVMRMQLRKKLAKKLDRLKSKDVDSQKGIRGRINRRRVKNLERQIGELDKEEALDKEDESGKERKKLASDKKPEAAPPPMLPVDEKAPGEKDSKSKDKDVDDKGELNKLAA